MTGDIVILSKAKYPKKHNADNILDISLTLNMTEQSLLIVITKETSFSKETSFCHDFAIVKQVQRSYFSNPHSPVIASKCTSICVAIHKPKK